MKLLHAMVWRLLMPSLFFAAASICVAQTPMMLGSSDNTSSDSNASLRIVEPAEGETVANNNGNVIVSLQAGPALADGTVELLLDGHPVEARRDGNAFFLSGVERGTHHLQARSISANGETAQSDPVTFNLWHASALFRRSAP